jgi:hypothetical protein
MLFMSDGYLIAITAKVGRLRSGEASPAEAEILVSEILTAAITMLEHIQYLQALLEDAPERSVQ